MYPLATVFPALQRVGKLPLARDQLVLLTVAVTEMLTGLDTYLAHDAGGMLSSREWIPVIFGPVAGMLLLAAGLLAIRSHTLASVIATLTLLGSIAVGLLGTYYHLQFGLHPDAPPGYRITLRLLEFAPPLLGPMMFAVIGVLGISAAWREDPPDSGILRLTPRWRLRLPYSETRAYFFIVGMAALATLISSALDHAQLHFAQPILLVPVGVGIFGTTVAVTLAALDRPTRGDYATYTWAMILMILVGLVGSILHINSNLIDGNQFVGERMLSGAPVMAPLLFCNVGLLGLLVLLDPGVLPENPKPVSGQALSQPRRSGR